MKWVLWVCLVGCSPLTALASGEVVVAGTRFPDHVDLSRLLIKEVPTQGTSQLCHVFAAVSLIESYCNSRRLRMDAHASLLKLSESYFSYRHLREKLSLVPAVAVSSQDAILGSLDTGFPQSTVTRFLSGSVLSNDEFPWSVEFGQAFARAKQAPGDQARAREVRDEFDDSFKEFAREHHLAIAASAQGGLFATTNNADVQACVAQAPRLVGPQQFYLKKALLLLSRGAPFVCSALFHRPAGFISSHATLVIGYRYNEQLRHDARYPSGIEFEVRDSASGKTEYWDIQNCENGMVYLSDENYT